MSSDQPKASPQAGQPHGQRPEREKLPLPFVLVALIVMTGALAGAIILVDKPSPQNEAAIDAR
jgi:hypothetical protein